jgi:general secretion pathway protein D
VRTPTFNIILLALGLLLFAPHAHAADPDDEGEATGDSDSDDTGDDGSEADGESQAQAPRAMLDPVRTPAMERRLDPASRERKKRSQSGPAETGDKGDDDDDDDEGSIITGVAGQEDDVPGGGDGQWSTAASVDRRGIITPPPRDTLVNIDFVETDLKDVIKYFAEITGRNFLLADSLKGKITIISPTPVTVAEAYEAFLSALDAAGFTTITEGRLTRVVPNKSSIREPIRLYTEEYLPYTANMVTRILRLENIAVDDITKIVSKMVGDGGDVTAYTPTNALIITDSANNIRRIEELLHELDISAPTQSVEIIELQWADATDMVEKIKTMFGVDEAAPQAVATQTPAERRRSKRNKRDKDTPSTPTAASSSDQVGSESYIGKIIADERTNSIILMATDQGIMDVRDFINRLDIDIEPRDGDIHVIYLEYANAEELAQVLSNLTQESNQRAQQTQQRGGRRTSTSQAGQKKEGAAPAAGGGSVAQFEGGVKVTADPSTNSLVITASRDDFLRLRRVIDMLDIRRKQVFVEAVIMEITDNNERDTGVGFHSGYGKEEMGESGLGMGAIGSVGGGSLLSALSGEAGLAMDLSGVALGIFGSSLPIPFPGSETGMLEIPAFGIVLTAIESDTNTEVLSAPNIMTLDNEEAEIVVGQTIPFSAGFTTTTQGMPIANFSREDVALTLRLTPQINESDTVMLEVFLEITEVVPESQGTDLLSSGGVTTTKRSAETMVAVLNNQTVVIGGLMQTNQTLDETKVPILGDIPLIGNLFRSKKSTDKKTNLLVFITPHVIDGPEDLQEVYQIKMLQRQEFMRMFYGKTLEEQQAALNGLLMYSMNLPDLPPVYRERHSAPRYDSVDLYDAEGGPTYSPPVFRPHPDDEVLEDEYPVEDEAYDDGYYEGYDEGYDEGEDEGYEEGYDEAYEEGEEDEEDEEEDEEEAPAESAPGGSSFAPGPGEVLITPGGGEIRIETATDEEFEQAGQDPYSGQGA